MRRKHRLAALLLIVAFAASVMGQGPSDKDDATEIARLYKEVQRLVQENSRHKKMLEEANRTIDRLRNENAELKKLCEDSGARGAQAAAARQMASFFRWVCDKQDQNNTAPEEKILFADSILLLLREWAGDNTERVRLINEVENVLVLRRATVDVPKKPEKPSRYSVAYDPTAIPALMRGLDRADRARMKGRLLGTDVSWHGVVLELSSDSSLFQLVLDCDGLTVYVDLADKRAGELRGVIIGTEVDLTGTVSDIGQEFTGAYSTLISQARVEACDPSIRKKQNLRRRR